MSFRQTLLLLVFAALGGLIVLCRDQLKSPESTMVTNNLMLIKLYESPVVKAPSSRISRQQESPFRLKQARLQKLYDLDGPQVTDAPYKAWYKDGTPDTGRPKSRRSSLAAIIKAAYPKD